MKRSDFYYALPEALIAQYPLAQRSGSRLLTLEKDGVLKDKMFDDVLSLIKQGDLLVFNDTRVIPARLFGHKTTGGQVEILLERILDTHTVLAQVRSSKTLKKDSQLILQEGVTAQVMGRENEFYRLSLHGKGTVVEILEAIGHIPLPPYITRQDETLDQDRYQTVFARYRGAVAAPTAGLHFDEKIMQQLQDKGIRTAFITLHVGAGTFQPVRVDDVDQHRMHSEYAEVTPQVCALIDETKRSGGRVVAVGTTVVRSLETAASSGELKPFRGTTEIFITPGYSFSCIDALVTNFHMPESTLLMLVCAFGGMENVLRAYHHAIQEKYRFYSYGDAMFLTKQITTAPIAPSPSGRGLG